MIQEILGMKKRGLTKIQIVDALSKIDMPKYIKETLGMNHSVDLIMSGYSKGILKNMSKFGTITDQTLQALVNIDKATYLSLLDDMAGTLKKDLSRAVLMELTPAEMLNSLTTAIRPDHARTLVNTSMNTFSRTVRNEMAESLPKTTLYAYFGPLDGKTRDICLKMLAAGELTKAEIETNFPGSFIDGGGYQCRHGWTITREIPASLINDKKAGKIIDLKKEQGKWTEPQTFKESLNG